MRQLPRAFGKSRDRCGDRGQLALLHGGDDFFEADVAVESTRSEAFLT